MSDKYIEIKNRILENIKLEDTQKVFPGDHHKLLYSCMDNIFKDVDHAMDNKFEKSFVDVDMVINLLNLLEKMVILQPLNDEIKHFINDIIQCIFNWNKNITKNSDIVYRVTVIERALNSMFTMAETINILKSLVNHLNERELTTNNLTNGLSLEYIKLLDLDE
jgi:hypothetical protein